MKIGLCATNLDDYLLPKDLDFIGVDHGVEELLKQGIKPIYSIGDFDSLKDKEILTKLAIKQLPERKDVTDTHAAIEYVIDKGYDEIEVYGVTGGRIDHFLAAMCLLEKYENINIKLIDKQNCITLLKPGIHKIESNGYYYFSLFACHESIISIKSAHYPLDNYLLKRSDPLCVSNQIKDNYTLIENSHNIILIQSKDKM